MSCEDELKGIFQVDSILDLVRKGFQLGKDYQKYTTRERELIGKLFDRNQTAGDFVNYLLDSTLTLDPQIVKSFLLLRQSKIVKGSLGVISPLEVQVQACDHVLLNKLTKPLVFKIKYQNQKFKRSNLFVADPKPWNSNKAALDTKAVEDVSKVYVLCQLLVQFKRE